MSQVLPLKGTKEVLAYLSALPANLEKNGMRAGLVAAAAVVRDEARLRAPHHTGLTAKSISSGSARVFPDGSAMITVRADPKKRHSFLAYFFEYGVSPHFIARTGPGEGRKAIAAAKGGKRKVHLRPLKIGSEFRTAIIEHPGLTARPFLRPALDAKAGEAIQAFGQRIKAFIEQKTGFAAPVDLGEAS